MNMNNFFLPFEEAKGKRIFNVMKKLKFIDENLDYKFGCRCWKLDIDKLMNHTLECIELLQFIGQANTRIGRSDLLKTTTRAKCLVFADMLLSSGAEMTKKTLRARLWSDDRNDLPLWSPVYSALKLNRLCRINGVTVQLGFHLQLDDFQALFRTHPEALQMKDPETGLSPIEVAAQNSSVEVLRELLQAFPNSTSISRRGKTLLHLAVMSCERSLDSNVSLHVENVQFLSATYPQMLHVGWKCNLLHGMILKGIEDCNHHDRANCSGGPYLVTPLHWAIYAGLDSDYYPMLKVVKTLIDSDTSILHDSFGFKDGSPVILPLHLFLLMQHSQGISFHTLSEHADCFRLLLKRYPEAIGIDSYIPGCEERTAYHLWYRRSHRYPEFIYFTRYMLRLEPTVDNLEWRRLNYESRRSALLMWNKTTIFFKLGVDLFKSIVSFL